MKYKVVAYFVENHNVADIVEVDDWKEAAELAVNWQDYYDHESPIYDEGEIIVCVEEVKGEFTDG